MASAMFQSYDRNLRRVYMLTLVEQLAADQRGGFRASLVVNAHTGLPIPDATSEERFLAPAPRAAVNSLAA